jgi:hypothetical protein
MGFSFFFLEVIFHNAMSSFVTRKEIMKMEQGLKLELQTAGKDWG